MYAIRLQNRLTFFLRYAKLIRPLRTGTQKSIPEKRESPTQLARPKGGKKQMYAIIENGGKQYKVSEGDVLKVEKLPQEVGEEVTFNVVMVAGDDGVKVGNDVKNAKVTAKVEAQDKFKKIIVFKYKPKKNERKKQGHRQPFTAVKIEKITL